MPVHENTENNSATKAQRIPFLSNKCLKKLRNQCSSWVEEFSTALVAPHSPSTPISAFEKACRKSQGKPFVFDDGNMRSLHFDKRTMQSAMWIEAPNELAFGYTRCMMGFLLSNPAPNHILMVGLGGGSLVKYCYKYLPKTRITVVEIDADVIALRDQCMIPPDDDRLQVIHMDAVKYLDQLEHEVDVILLDGFDADGLATDLITDDFYAACKNALSQEGILVSNMWGESKDLAATISRMNTIFNNSVWWCRSIDSYNLISFAFKSVTNEFSENLEERAKQLDQDFRLELKKLIGRLQTISGKSFSDVGAPVSSQVGLLSLMYREEIAEKIRDLLVADEMIARTRLEWMDAHQHPESLELENS
jgi:spermidine synthase